MELQDLAKHWTAFGEQEPLWAVLTDPRLRDGTWGVEDFLATGRENIADVLDRARALGVLPASRAAALDFGCGVGRLSQALAEHFDRVTGIDIAPTMVDYARRLNPYGERVQFLVNERDDLAVIPDADVDLVFSLIVLQHMRPQYSKRYIGEFVRILRPGGLAVFQIPIGEIPPPEVRRLPAGSYRAELAILSAPATLKAGEQATIRVAVTNRGDATWVHGRNDTTAINVGDHWRRLNGTWANQDDGRAGLPGNLDPGQTTEVDLVVTAPQASGPLTLEVDLVHEAVCWFADLGSPVASVPVEVLGGPVGRPRRSLLSRLRPGSANGSSPVSEVSAEEPFTPQMELYAVPEAEVRALVEASGGRVVAADEDWWPGPLWRSRTFYVTRD